jgi:acetyl esterase
VVLTAEYDPLRDEGEAYARRLTDAGIPCELIRGPGLIHGFLRRTAFFDAAKPILGQVCHAINAVRAVS